MSPSIIRKRKRLPAGLDSVSVLEGTALISGVLRRKDAGNDWLTAHNLKQKYTSSDMTTALLRSPFCMQPCVFKTHTHCSHTAATNTSADGTDQLSVLSESGAHECTGGDVPLARCLCCMKDVTTAAWDSASQASLFAKLSCSKKSPSPSGRRCSATGT